MSEVISRLKAIQDEHGDIQVKICMPGLPKKPIISGIRIVKANKQKEIPYIDIVPRYDITGYLAEASSVNTIAYQFATTQTMFRQFATGILSVKAILENFKVIGKKVMYNGKNVELVPMIRGKFKKLFDIAKNIQDGIIEISGFDKRLSAVVKEPFRQEDYASAYSHGIDITLSDAEFAKAITEGIGDKTSVQRLAVFVDVMRKINKEIESRRQRIAQLDKRISAEKGTNEGLNAKILKSKAEGIIETLMKRRIYMLERYNALRQSIIANVQSLSDEITDLAEA